MAFSPDTQPTEQKSVKSVNLLKDQVGAYPARAPAPKGSQEFDRNVLRTIAGELPAGSGGFFDGRRRSQIGTWVYFASAFFRILNSSRQD